MPAHALDVSAATFARDVIDRSKEVVVVVDFWAPWCGPCQVLGPVLEDAVARTGGKAVLAKVNVDENQQLAAQFGVSGIPAVKAFKDGVVVAEFVGAQPAHVVEAWVRQLVPAEDEDVVSRARRLLAAGDVAEAEATLRRFLMKEPEDGKVLLELARIVAARGAVDEAKELLAKIPDGAPEKEAADREVLLIEMIAAGAAAGGVEAARARVEANPDDADARFALAGAYLAAGRTRDAMEQLLEIVKRDRAYRDDGARRTLLALFDHLGADHPDVQDLRNRLAMILFA